MKRCIFKINLDGSSRETADSKGANIPTAISMQGVLSLDLFSTSDQIKVHLLLVVRHEAMFQIHW